jgi:hypothetical protein
MLVNPPRLVTVLLWQPPTYLLEALDKERPVEYIGFLNVTFHPYGDGAFDYRATDKSVVVLGASFLQPVIMPWISVDM